LATVQTLVIVAKRDKQEAVALAAKIRAAARLAESRLMERPAAKKAFGG
jgi:hypothetical protein